MPGLELSAYHSISCAALMVSAAACLRHVSTQRHPTNALPNTVFLAASLCIIVLLLADASETAVVAVVRVGDLTKATSGSHRSIHFATS
jgi:hypothetical protein